MLGWFWWPLAGRRADGREVTHAMVVAILSDGGGEDDDGGDGGRCWVVVVAATESLEGFVHKDGMAGSFLVYEGGVDNIREAILTAAPGI
ncbi:hypothetical protein M6B38_235320 [Iris pallida]|uniref:Uncharacterized protein n=1 Tax=Iris pallida TaxID=29817 RepID=A0AAX6DPC9_IRIPA|nr:hypothetical protein M6B38_235320 [Iris pallida]